MSSSATTYFSGASMTLSSVTYSQALIFLMSSLPNMRMLHLELRVSDLEQSLAFYTALNYAELGRVPRQSSAA